MTTHRGTYRAQSRSIARVFGCNEVVIEHRFAPFHLSLNTLGIGINKSFAGLQLRPRIGATARGRETHTFGRDEGRDNIRASTARSSLEGRVAFLCLFHRTTEFHVVQCSKTMRNYANPVVSGALADRVCRDAIARNVLEQIGNRSTTSRRTFTGCS
jgi:hypothetical protein